MLDSHLLWNLMYDDPGYDVVHNNSENILRDLELGLWIIRMSPDNSMNELFLDKNCSEILAVSKAFSPQECYEHWHSRVCPECGDYVQQMFKKMITSGKNVQLEYNWQHPNVGVVRVRCVGVRAADSNGMITLKGYHRIISNIIQTSFLDPNI
ncbi:MAG: PAS domain-containing protein [Phascolarctobacterium sp.]|nr:PAS domain-containing protein [Phascolarctobacterium sp.]